MTTLTCRPPYNGNTEVLSKPSTKRNYPAILRSEVNKRRRRLTYIEKHDENDPLTSSEQETLVEWQNILGKTKQTSEAVFILGPMCAGKTTTIRRFKSSKKYKKFAYVDTDEIMEGLKGYDNRSVDMFYPSARKISCYLTDWLLDQKLSFIAEGTCVLYKELEDYMIRLKEQGYVIKVKKINDTPLDLILERSRGRTRYISPETLTDIFVNSNKSLKKLFERNKNTGLFEEFV